MKTPTEAVDTEVPDDSVDMSHWPGSHQETAIEEPEPVPHHKYHLEVDE